MSLVAQYLFKDNANDSLGNWNLNGYNITYSNIPEGRNFGGKVAVFNGTNSYAQSQATTTIWNGNFSILTWASYDTSKFGTSNATRTVISGGAYSSNTWLSAGLEEVSFKYILSFHGNYCYSTVGNYKDTNWHQLAFTYDRNTRTFCIYRDKVLIGSATGTQTPVFIYLTPLILCDII